MRGVVGSILGMLEEGATHVGVATDHVIESFRNALWPGYKTGEGIDPVLFAQFAPLEEALAALGVVVWPMVEFEADDALAAAAAMAAADARVEQVVVCTPDKDLAQCVRGDRVVQLDRRRREIARRGGRGEEVRGAARVDPRLAGARRRRRGRLSRPARLGRRVRGGGARALRAPRGHPGAASAWDVPVRGAARLAATLAEQRERARLFRTLATLRADAPIGVDVDALRWTGPRRRLRGLGRAARHARAARARRPPGRGPRRGGALSRTRA